MKRPSDLGSERSAFGIPSATLFAAYVGTIYGANWALGKLGVVGIGFGLMAPAGVYFAGLALGLRDALHERTNTLVVLLAIAVGCAASYLWADAVQIPGGKVTIALASAIAFGLSELADLAVYTPLRERHWVAGVVASNAVGAAIDSLVFLPLAFGSRNGWVDLTIGKLYLIPLGLLLVGAVRRWLR